MSLVIFEWQTLGFFLLNFFQPTVTRAFRCLFRRNYPVTKAMVLNNIFGQKKFLVTLRFFSIHIHTFGPCPFLTIFKKLKIACFLKIRNFFLKNFPEKTRTIDRTHKNTISPKKIEKKNWKTQKLQPLTSRFWDLAFLLRIRLFFYNTNSRPHFGFFERFSNFFWEKTTGIDRKPKNTIPVKISKKNLEKRKS